MECPVGRITLESMMTFLQLVVGLYAIFPSIDVMTRNKKTIEKVLGGLPEIEELSVERKALLNASILELFGSEQTQEDKVNREIQVASYLISSAFFVVLLAGTIWPHYCIEIVTFLFFVLLAVLPLLGRALYGSSSERQMRRRLGEVLRHMLGVN